MLNVTNTLASRLKPRVLLIDQLPPAELMV
jgi:hypothetical protein